MKYIPHTRNTLLGLLLGLSAHSFAGYPVDINSADAVELAKALDGVGLSKAEAIIAYREQFGPFITADDLRSVRGIGNATLERNRDNILLVSESDSPSE